MVLIESGGVGEIIVKEKVEFGYFLYFFSCVDVKFFGCVL